MLTKELQLSLFAAFKEAKNRKHEFVLVEHLLFSLLYNSAIEKIISFFKTDLNELRNSVETFLSTQIEKMPEGKESNPIESIALQRVIQRAIIHVESAEKEDVEASDIFISIFSEKHSHAVFFLKTGGLDRLSILKFISHNPLYIMYTENDDEDDINFDNFPDDDLEWDDNFDPSEDIFSKLVIDISEQAAKGELDPLIGRDKELTRLKQVLCRRKKNNPILVGEPGVGKTAIAQGLAIALEKDNVPAMLKDYKLLELDMGSVVAGTKFRGQFEEKMKMIIEKVKSMGKVILFIDEIHTIVGAGAVGDSPLDASNLLKPVLASGEIKCIGATTDAEYKNGIEKDTALSRRFQKIRVTEPSITETVLILNGLKSKYEEFHKITFTKSALIAAAELSAKYINDRQLPDKAIDVIDEAAAANHLRSKSKMKLRISKSDIEQVVAFIAGVPVEKAGSSEIEKLAGLPKILKRLIFGQDSAITALSQALRRSRAGLGNQLKPIGSFLFTGPTGVGKTEISKQLAKQLGINFVRFDMSEYMEKHAVSRLIGAPPGYVGYEKGGILTEKIRKFPYSVLLLDEIEKAHPDIFNILLQIMDHAGLTDNNGRETDFRNVILIMTSNAGTREMNNASIGFGEDDKDSNSKGKKALEKLFSPEFRNRLDETIIFKPLSEKTMLSIVDKFLIQLDFHLDRKKIKLTTPEEVKIWLAKNGYDKKFGARPLDRLIQKSLQDPLSEEILFGKLTNGGQVESYIENNKIKLKIEQKK